MLSLAFFASGSGTNMEAVLAKVESGELLARPAFVLSNNSNSGALEKARRAQIPAYHVSSRTHPHPQEAAGEMKRLLQEHQIDLLVLAGFMKKLPEEVIAYMPNRIINIHPALLPAFGGEGFYGDRIHAAVLNRGCQFTGVTVHAVNGAYDEGPILLQRVVSVPAEADVPALRQRVLAVEYDTLWRVINGFARGILKGSAEGITGIKSFRAEISLQFSPRES